MRTSRLTGLALAAALVLTELAAAQAPRVEITDVRIGYPGSINRANNRGARQTRFKVGAWAPVYVDLEVRDAQLKDYSLSIETTDSDDLQNVYVEKRFLPPVDPMQPQTLLTYVRIGSGSSEITVRLTDAKGKELRKKQITQADFDALSANVYGYLTLGGKTKSLFQALVTAKGQAAAGPNVVAPRDGDQEGDLPDPAENGYRSFAHVDQVLQMPTYWFGYQPADTVVLLTSKQDFATDLNTVGQDNPFSARREALAEWVRRGGRLVVSVSKNHQEVNQILGQMKIIDLTIEGRAQVPGLPGVARWVGQADFPGLRPKNQPDAQPLMEIARLKPGPGVQVLAYDKTAPGGDARPAVVQAPCGLGQVIVVAFDLDEQPFTTWPGRSKFWKPALQHIVEPPDVGEGALQDRNQWGGFNNSQGNNELAGKLVRTLEAFPDVPVISFGWVALFIVIYILIVGPLDYFFLKKVVKRLELTWITFPAVVIIISAVAYFAAYYLKGKDLRINKVDVVDVDLRGGNVYGNTWFTLFSPRIENYTVGVEPGSGWGPEERDPRKYSPFVSWMSRPEEGWSAGRGGSGSLFRRAYDYAPDKDYPDQPPSAGLVGVPIQVWSTKTFSASWVRPIKEDELLEARIEVAKNDPTRKKLSGTLTSHLPVELRDVVLLYRNQFYPLDNLVPGSPQRIDAKMGAGGVVSTWLGQHLVAPQNVPAAGRRGTSYNENRTEPVGEYIKSILFHSQAGNVQGQGARNSSLRFLDQNWRLDDGNTAEAILFGRAAPAAGTSGDGNADEISNSGLSASKLWLRSLPGGSGQRRDIQGTLSQDTYVRVYIPVK